MSIFWSIFVQFFGFLMSEQSELLGVVVLFRHGNRSPRIMYKNDPYIKDIPKIWPEGLGQLTKVGKQQAFALGQWYRKYYDSFIPEEYNNDFVRVESSDLDRTLMSASCVLAGLYPPKNQEVWNEDIKWQPIPVHTIPRELDAVISGDRECLKYNSLYEKMLQSESYLQYVQSKKGVLDYLSEQTGDSIKSPFDVVPIHDSLFVESFFNLSLPAWTKKVFPEETLPLLTVTWALESNNTALGRFKSGRLVDRITTFFEEIIEDNNSQKLLMLSGHDSTIARLMNVLGVYKHFWPLYSSTFGFELRKKGSQVFLNLYYRDTEKFEKIKLPECDNDCKFDEFKKITKKLRISDKEWVKECNSV